MPYLLAVAALAIPILLVVQTIRGRIRPQCCAVPVEQDARMHDAAPVARRGV